MVLYCIQDSSPLEDWADTVDKEREKEKYSGEDKNDEQPAEGNDEAQIVGELNVDEDFLYKRNQKGTITYQ